MDLRMRRIVASGAAALLFVLSPALAAAATPRVAVLPFENKSGDPRYDYVGAIAGGLLQFDLSSSAAVALVDRGALDAALREKELSLSAVAADPSRIAKNQGALEGADYLLAGEYVFLGKELLFTVNLIDVATTRASSFSEGGSTENVVHALAERVVEKLSGKRMSFRGEGKARSILSLRDETPGSIALHSPLIDAEISLDGAFIGYTTGDRRKPFIIDNLEPGEHVVSTDLGRDFGVVKLPEVTFGPWKQTVNVPSGKRVVVTDESTHFNNVLYRLQRVLSVSKTATFDKGKFSVRAPFAFTDRKGVPHTGSAALELALSDDGKSASGRALFSLDGESRDAPILSGEGKSAEIRTAMGLVDFSAKVEARYGRFDFEMEAERTDVRQGMHREGE